MKFVCERCHTKYSIADEKVRGKVLKVRCKTCENVITVRESGATIDEPLAAGPKDAPILRSGTLDGPAAAGLSAGGPSTARRSSGVAAPVGTAAAVARPTMPAAAFTDPLAPSAAPPPRRRAPTPGPAAALAVVLDDGLDWYLAVDGAQTGPFNRPTLIEKILAVPAGGDIHIWNAGLGAWKPPKDVSDVQADLVRVRRAVAPAPPPPVPRRPSGAMPTVAARGVGGDQLAHRTGSVNGVSAHAESAADAHGPKGSEHKRNGVGAPAAGAAAAPATAAKAHGGLGLEDLYNEPTGGVVAAGPAAFGAMPSATMSSSAAVAPVPGGPAVPGRSVRQTKLIVGAVGLVAIVCGIVAVVALRKPTASPTAGTPPPPTETEKVAKAPAVAPPVAPANPPPSTAPAVDPPPVAAKVDGHADPRATKGGRVKGRRKGEGGGLSSTTPPPMAGGMTAEQMQAANRFGDSSSRDVRPTSGSLPTARSTPAQADISRVITNNRQGIQTCYQRALLRDSTLTQGRVTVRVWIGLSGKVKSVSLDAPPPFRTMESCVRDVMSRWAFPPSSEEYGTEFPFLLQGNQ